MDEVSADGGKVSRRTERVFIFCRVRNCLLLQSTIQTNTNQLSNILFELPRPVFLAHTKDLLCIDKVISSQDLSSLNPDPTQLDFPSRLQGLGSTMHRHTCDFLHKSMGIDEAKVALCGFSPIVAFSMFMALLVVPFVRNASVFPANMHNSRSIAMPHYIIDIAGALHADLEIRFSFIVSRVRRLEGSRYSATRSPTRLRLSRKKRH